MMVSSQSCGSSSVLRRLLVRAPSATQRQSTARTFHLFRRRRLAGSDGRRTDKRLAPVTAWPFEMAIASTPHWIHFSPMIRLHRIQNRVIRLRTERDEGELATVMRD